MSTESDQLDVIAVARRDLRAAELGEIEAGNVLRLARARVRQAKERLSEAIDEALDARRQPRLPFEEAAGAVVAKLVERPATAGKLIERLESTDFVGGDEDAPTPPTAEPVAKSWRDMTLEAAGYMAGDDAFEEEVCAALVAADVRTCGQLADRLMAAETFGLRLVELGPVYAAVEMLSEDDAEPLDFDARFGPPAPEPVAQPAMLAPVCAVPRCRLCGCVEENCARCVERTGRPCSWASPAKDLCTACLPLLEADFSVLFIGLDALPDYGTTTKLAAAMLRTVGHVLALDALKPPKGLKADKVEELKAAAEKWVERRLAPVETGDALSPPKPRRARKAKKAGAK